METVQTPLEELRQSDLKHYDELSTQCHHWSSGVPRAINFYYDYKQMNLIQRIILAFKNK
jgi:hypothetical protein